MEMDVKKLSLLRLSILKTAGLLKRGYWRDTYDFNPFCALPSHVVEKLVSNVTRLSPPGTLKMSELYPLLTSGRIRNFKVKDVIITSDELVGILMCMSIRGEYLTSVVLRHVCIKNVCLLQPGQVSKQSSSLDCLLEMSPLLELLETNIEFDLRLVQKLPLLKRLNLKFMPNCPLTNILSETEGVSIPNYSLVYFCIYERRQCRKEHLNEEFASILKYCKNLEFIENDIAKSLEILHGEELYTGVLTAEYKLHRCILGNVLSYNKGAVASVTEIQIASITCPNLNELDVLVNDHNSIYALSDFQNLSSLLIQWELADVGDFRLGLQLVLEKIGFKLKSLSIIHFGYVDYYAIAKSCPSLELLNVEFDRESRDFAHSNLTSEKLFVNLKSIRLECTDDNSLSSDTLLSILSDCCELTYLSISNNVFLTDDVITKVFEKNSLTQLKALAILCCGITLQSFRLIALKCKSLYTLRFYSPDVLTEDAIEVVHSINPHIIMCVDHHF